MPSQLLPCNQVKMPWISVSDAATRWAALFQREWEDVGVLPSPSVTESPITGKRMPAVIRRYKAGRMICRHCRGRTGRMTRERPFRTSLVYDQWLARRRSAILRSAMG